MTTRWRIGLAALGLGLLSALLVTRPWSGQAAPTPTVSQAAVDPVAPLVPEETGPVEDTSNGPVTATPAVQGDPGALAREQEAAQQGDVRAQVGLGDRYLAGMGVPPDDAEALRWYRLAAEKGDPAAQVKLGLMYENAQGTAKNLDEAFKWYKAAADQGDAAAQANLGDLYEVGWGSQDYTAAARYYRLAAEQNYAEAQFDLGRMYENAMGVSRDYVEAYVWYDLAAKNGNLAAGQRRDFLAGQMDPRQYARARELAVERRISQASKPPGQP